MAETAGRVAKVVKTKKVVKVGRVEMVGMAATASSSLRQVQSPPLHLRSLLIRPPLLQQSVLTRLRRAPPSL